MKRLLLFATLEEAKSSLDSLQAKEIAPGVFHFSKGTLVISGWGSFAAHGATLRHGLDVTEIWNLGLAGSLHPDLELGSMHEISTVSKYTFSPPLDTTSKTIVAKTFPDFPLSLPGKRLLTSDFPLHDSALRKTLAERADLIDMEGYGVAHGAALLGKPVRFFKIVSDFSSENGRALLLKNREKYSLTLSKVLL